MKSKLLFETSGQRIFAVIFDPEDEVVAGLEAFARNIAIIHSGMNGDRKCESVSDHLATIAPAPYMQNCKLQIM